MRRHLRNYEKPEGWSKGQPEVLVIKKVIEKLGEPVVNYDGLHQYLTDDFDIPYDSKTFIKLYGRYKYSILGGFHYPYTQAIYVNPIAAEYALEKQGGTMNVLAHELRHRSESINRKVLVAAESVLRWASYEAGFEITQHNHIPALPLSAVAGGVLARKVYYGIEPAEIRARKEAKRLVSSPHQADILFPNTNRAAVMVAASLVPAGAAEKLGGTDNLRRRAEELGVLITRDESNVTINYPVGEYEKEYQQIITLPPQSFE